jgi:membrane protein DedA with SNARE-associated domain
MIDQLLGWIQEHSALGMLLIFFIALLESLAVVGVLVPGALFMIAVGGLVASDALNFYLVCFWAVLGAIAGDALSYHLGRHYSEQAKSIYWLKNHQKVMEQSQRFVDKHGMASVMMGRFIGPLRAFVPLCVGLLKMPRHQFYITNILSAIIWAPVYLLPGMMATMVTSAGKASLWYVLIWGLFTSWVVALMLSELKHRGDALFGLSKLFWRYVLIATALTAVWVCTPLYNDSIIIVDSLIELGMRHWR